MYDKSKFTTEPELALVVSSTEVAELSSLIDSETWSHVSMTIDWEQRKLSGYFNGQLIGETDIPTYFTLVSASGTSKQYGRGGYAVFGQTPVTDEDSALGLKSNNGVDDIIIAHTAFDADTVQDVYAGEIPAYSPTPQNGKSLDITALNTLMWKSSPNLNVQVKEYRVRLSTAESLESPVIDEITTSKSVDISGLSEGVYYWSVDIVLNDDSEITGEVWSIVDEQASLSPLSNRTGTYNDQVETYDAELYNFEGDMQEFDGD